jgi:hypothetical protein
LGIHLFLGIILAFATAYSIYDAPSKEFQVVFLTTNTVNKVPAIGKMLFIKFNLNTIYIGCKKKTQCAKV